jgi:hypothetical protein
LTNQGVIDATGTNPLIIDTGASAVTNSGTLEATGNSTLFIASNVTNTGQLIANNGTAIFAGAVSGTGTATVQGAGSIEFGSTTTSNITFAAGADGTVTFDAASTLTGKLSVTGFTLGDTIDLADINFSGSGPTLTFSKGILTVSDGTDTAKLKMIGNYTLANFHVAPDGSGGTLITDPPLTSSQSANIADGTVSVPSHIQDVASREAIGGQLPLRDPQAWADPRIAQVLGAPEPTVMSPLGGPWGAPPIWSNPHHAGVTSPPGVDQVVALFNQFIAASFPDHNGTPITNALSQIVTNQEQFLAQPHHG